MRTLLLLLIPVFSFSQVGIYTQNPTATLHVAGTSSTVKIEGLSTDYNVNNLGTQSTTRVFVNEDGDLVLGERTDNIAFIFDIQDYIPNNREQKVNQTGTGSNFQYLTSGDIYHPSFTLPVDGIIEVNYSLSWRMERNNAQRVSDKGARVIKTAVFIKNNATGNFLPDSYAITGQFYSNGSTSEGADQWFYNTASDYISLPAGTYTIIFGGLVQAGGNSTVASYFGGRDDQLQVIAYY
jgi:hypothetical protein